MYAPRSSTEGRPRQPAKAKRHWSLTKTCLARHVVFHFLVPVAWNPFNVTVVCGPNSPAPRQMLLLSLFQSQRCLPLPAASTVPTPSIRVLVFLVAVSLSRNQVAHQPRAMFPPCCSLLLCRRTSSLLPSLPPASLYPGLSPPQSPPFLPRYCVLILVAPVSLVRPVGHQCESLLEVMSIGALRRTWLREARHAGLPPPLGLFVVPVMLVILVGLLLFIHSR